MAKSDIEKDMDAESKKRRNLNPGGEKSNSGSNRAEQVKQKAAEAKDYAKEKGGQAVEKGKGLWNSTKERASRMGSDFKEGYRTPPQRPAPPSPPQEVVRQTVRQRGVNPATGKPFPAQNKIYFQTPGGEPPPQGPRGPVSLSGRAGVMAGDVVRGAKGAASSAGITGGAILRNAPALGAIYEGTKPGFDAAAEYANAPANFRKEGLRNLGFTPSDTGWAGTDWLGDMGKLGAYGIGELWGKTLPESVNMRPMPGWEGDRAGNVKYIPADPKNGTPARFADLNNDMYYTLDDQGRPVYDTEEYTQRALGDQPGGITARPNEDGTPGTVKAPVGTPGYWGKYTSFTGDTVDPTAVGLRKGDAIPQAPRYSKDAQGNLIINDDYGIGDQNVRMQANAGGIRGAYKLTGGNGVTEYTDAPGSGLNTRLNNPVDPAVSSALDTQGRSEMTLGKRDRAIEKMSPSEYLKYKESLKDDRLSLIQLEKAQIDLDERKRGAKMDNLEKSYRILETIGDTELAKKYAPQIAAFGDELSEQALGAMPLVDKVMKELNKFSTEGTFLESLFGSSEPGTFAGADYNPTVGAQNLVDLYNAFTPNADGFTANEITLGDKTMRFDDMSNAQKESLAKIIRAMDFGPAKELVQTMAGNPMNQPVVKAGLR